jgi:hypothetical protein
VRDLVSANSDRRLAAIGIVNATDRESARAQAKSLQLEYPIAMHDFDQGGLAFVDLAAQPVSFVFVVGRGGGLAWMGDPVAEERKFLAALNAALALPEVVRIERPLHERLNKARGEYYAGRLSRALDMAVNEQKVAEKGADSALLDDARLLERAALDAQHTWLRAISEAAARKDATAYVSLLGACETGFARGEVAKDLERIEKELHKNNFFEMLVLDAKKYQALMEDRPVLFPSRKESAGDRFAKKLEGFVRSTSNSTNESRTAQALVDRNKFTAR